MAIQSNETTEESSTRNDTRDGDTHIRFPLANDQRYCASRLDGFLMETLKPHQVRSCLVGRPHRNDGFFGFKKLIDSASVSAYWIRYASITFRHLD
jgi:hypothetical protein